MFQNYFEIYFILLYFLDLTSKNVINCADKWCDGYYDENNEYFKERRCTVAKTYCCGTCYNRTCCSDKAFFLNQTACVSSMPLWMIIFICIWGILLCYCCLLLLNQICMRLYRRPLRVSTDSTNNANQSGRSNRVHHTDDRGRNEFDPSSYPTVYYDVFQQDTPPTYESLKLDTLPKPPPQAQKPQ